MLNCLWWQDFPVSNATNSICAVQGDTAHPVLFADFQMGLQVCSTPVMQVKVRRQVNR